MPDPVVTPALSVLRHTPTPRIHWPLNLAGSEPIGGKARNLLSLTRGSFPVPAWFVVVPDNGRPPIPQSVFFEDLALQIEAELRKLCPNNELVAVRSSAQEEDSAEHSFAGQLESYLFVRPQDVVARVRAVWESAQSKHVDAYRRQHGLSRAKGLPAVVIQRMVHSHCSGVAFTADAVSGRRGIVVVSATSGTGSALVSGECDGDIYHVDRKDAIVHRATAAQGPQVLTDDQVVAVTQLARRVQRHFHAPQDVEWTMDADGALFLLQARPITTMKDLPDPDGALRIWDNSNIVESYGGLTTPLTFSFARTCYAEVYRQFCRLLRVPAATITRHDSVFRCMLGYIRGRMYYNLLNWYALLSILPGYRVNRRFMEQMMGVKERLPDREAVLPMHDAGASRFRDGLRMLASAAALVKEHFLIEKNVARFHQRVAGALGETRPDLSQCRPDELVSLYRSLESQLLSAWDAPLVNDFLAMIFYGLLRRLCIKWCDDRNGSAQNDLLAGGGGMISAEPAERIREMAAILRDQPGLRHSFKNDTRQEIEAAMNLSPPLKRAITDYVAKFGDRCEDELKLESPTLHDDPLPLYRSVGQLASLPVSVPLKSAGIGEDAEQQIGKALSGHPLRRLVFRWVLHNCRKRVRDRENLRFERTRVFGRVRMIFTELGHQLHGWGALESPADVFFLEVDELLGYVEGTATCTDLRGLSGLRKMEHERWRHAAVPAERFETRGAVHCTGNAFQPSEFAKPSGGEQRNGVGCSPGKVRGRVKIVRSTADAPPPGSILVAERTDPSWILLFPLASGVLVERGSVLSHVSIVGREMRIPIVTSVAGLTSWLADGDLVEMDGSSGVVTRLDPKRGQGTSIEQAPGKDCILPSQSREPLPGSAIPDTAIVRYGQCWEDADVLCAALEIERGDACLSIASGGDNTLALLSFCPARVLAVDTNAAQLGCLALRVAAFQSLEHSEMLELLGWRPSQRRRQLFLRARKGLAPAYREFWDRNLQAIEGGAVSVGRLDQYLVRFRRHILPLIHGDRTLEQLFHDRSQKERADFYDKVWDTWRWRLLFRIFFSRLVMRRLGRDPGYFRYAEGSVAARLLQHTRRALVQLPASLNPYLQWMLQADQATALPFALREENFDKIRRNLDRLELRCSSVEDAIAQDGPFDRMNLSNVFEYMSPELYRAVLESIAKKSRPGARLTYWNMAVERRRPECLAGQLRPLQDLSFKLFPQAKAFFYRDLVIEEVL